jgi:hypothetical protein
LAGSRLAATTDRPISQYPAAARIGPENEAAMIPKKSIVSQAAIPRRPAGFIPVRGEKTGKLLFYLDVERELIEIKIGNNLERIDLRRYIDNRSE